MRLEEALSLVPEVLPETFENFGRHLNAEWISDALVATGTATIRRRRLPAEQTVWLLIGMALMRNESIERVAALLGVALPAKNSEYVVKIALPQARARIGDGPLEYIFTASGAEWGRKSADAHRYRGLAVYAVDGATMRVPDTTENWKTFGGQEGNGERAGSACPMVGRGSESAVRGRYESALHYKSQEHHAHTRNQALGNDDALVEIELSPETRRIQPGLPECWTVRAISYQRKGFPKSVLLTSLLDSGTYPRSELVAPQVVRLHAGFAK